MKLTLDKKILTGFIACTIILLAVAIISIKNSEKFIDTNQWVNHTHEVLYEFEQILVTSVDAETGMRGYVITGNEIFLDPFKASKSLILEHLDKVKELTRDNLTQQKNITLLSEQVNLHLKHLEGCIQLRKKDFDKARGQMASGEGKHIMDGIRRMIDDAKGIEQKLLIERRQTSDEDTRNFNQMFIMLLVIIVIVLISVYFIITANLRALRKAEKETADKNWNLTGSSELARGVQGNKQMMEIAQSIINHLANYLEAHIGAFYVVEENNVQLRLVSGHALDKQKKDNPFIRLGEGIVGQAAEQNSMVLLEDVPPEYFMINTSFGGLKPKNILAFPFVFEDVVVAVVELGSIKGFTNHQKQYLQLVADNVAIAVTSSQVREKAKELLEETQRQSEELETQQEELIRSNEELLRIQTDIKAQNNIINSVAIVSRADIRGDITYVNDEFLKWSKYSKEEVIGQNHRLLKSGDQPNEVFVDLWKTISSGKIWRGELKNKAKDGSYYWVDAIIAPVLDHNGKPREYIAQRFVINEKKQREQEMQELLEETQRQGEILEAQQEELKQSNEELQEKTILLEKSEGELKAQQEELHQSNEELESKAVLLEEQKDRLENAKIELENKAQELETTSKYKSEFLANMSHELRTPLNSVLILAQLLAENKNKTLSGKEMEFARNICNSGNDLLSLINEILDLSKVESGKMDLDVAEVPIQEVTDDLLAMFTEVAKNKSVEFTIQFHEKGLAPHITTDKQRLEQILRNLLSNAFKFTDKKGKVTLAIEAPAKEVVYKNNQLYYTSVVAFSVTDTGIGIPKDKLQIIFEAFQQVDGSTKRKYGGTGLGLSISRELAQALGGEIQVHSEEEKGSTFTLFLPMIFDAPASNIPKTAEVKHTNTLVPEKIILPTKIEPGTTEEVHDDRYDIQENDKIVLLMEDDLDFAILLLGFIRERNYKGIIALQGNTGLSYARHYKPDAIMLDMKLPVMDGAEVLKQLKNDPMLRHIPVQVISGYDRKREGMELGAFDFLRKPVTKDVILGAFDKIEEFVRKKLKKLLIVEDDETQNLAIKELIGNGDVKSVSAYSGKEAYEMLSNEKFDCIIVDLGLPDMTGFQLLEKIKENTMLNRIPVVVYTGKDLNKDEKALLNKLANTVVLKTADSKERLLDETILFLHRVESQLPKEKQTIIRKLHKTEEILRNKKVLVVDDDIRNVYSLTNVLEEEEMYCFTAENGKMALKALKENPNIDIVLMDIMMPEMDGFEATREIRKLSKFNKIPIIALTAKAMKGDREKCLEAGMSDYVSKPVNIEQLLSLMRVWLYR